MHILFSRRSRSLAIFVVAAVSVSALTPEVSRATGIAPSVLVDADIAGVVRDSSSAQPISGAEISISRDGRVVANVTSDQFGHFIIHNAPTGAYSIDVRFIGFRPAKRIIAVAANDRLNLTFLMNAVASELQGVTIVASAPIAVDIRSGDQVYKQNDYHGAPSTTTSQILQQSIAGAVRAPTGEVHIRGQHAEYTYYVDGVPVPSGISGSLNELFDPAIIDRIEFQTGGWDAEYGNKNAAVVDVHTRIPGGGFHLNVSGFGGTFGVDGQSINVSNNIGKWGFFFSGSRQATNLRQEPIVFDTITFKPINYHNSAQDYFTFGKVQYNATPRDVFDFEGNWSRTRFLVPYDSMQSSVDDHQVDQNSFVNAGWRHRFGNLDSSDVTNSELFAGLYYRRGSLDYVPGSADEPSFLFFPDTTTPYNVAEQRAFNLFGTKIDYRWRAMHSLELKTGLQASITTGREDFITTDASGRAGPGSNSNLKGHDVGGYVQGAFTPREWIELRAGLRTDLHAAPFAGNQTQLSPRVKLSFYPNLANTFYLYYGRQFIPTNIEDLRAITTVSNAGDTTSSSPTLPERDNFYEAGFIHRFPFGVVSKISSYLKQSSPGIDDNTIPGTAILTSVNLDKVRIQGLEAVIEIRPPGPISGYLNFAANHAIGHGPVTGGFFPSDIADVPGRWFDLDHDQRISSVASAVYSKNRFFLSATGIYGSGLTNGADITTPIGTGLFDFNKDIHVDSNIILNAATGYSFVVGKRVVRPQLFVDNLLDRKYLLKGAFFSGASAGRPRTVQLRVDIGI
ncbi:MAG: carboxypeptidase regulatory-like domain-containing protein [Gemmatimonadaceae bacterium]